MGLGSMINFEKVDIGSVFSGFGALLKDIRTAITGKAPLDPTKLAELEAKALEMEQLLMNAQVEINKIEAASPRLFVAGWRPFIGWICGLGIFYHFIGYQLFCWVVVAFRLGVIPPELNTEGLLSLVFALLGVGTMRTYEKIRGVVNQH